MNELEALRGEIDEVDAQLVRLFARRMDITRRVGEYKQAAGLPVLDQAREKAVLREKVALAADPALGPDVTALFETIMGISRRQQHALVHEVPPSDAVFPMNACRAPVADPVVAYQGVPGAYSEAATTDFFGPAVHSLGLRQFEDVFVALKDGRADYGVVPIENSSTGAIRQIYDLLTKYECYLVGETTVKVDHCLLAPKGATLDTIQNVYSHEQGLFQCEQFLNDYPHWRQQAHADTAGSAKYVAESGDITKAAIASSRAAELYGLDILARSINFNTNNTTRFVVVSPVAELREGRDKISTIITAQHRSGSLHEILTIFAVNGLNMLRLESRPMPGRSWEYMFFLEFSGDLTAPGMDGVLTELGQTAAGVRILGNFKSNL